MRIPIVILLFILNQSLLAQYNLNKVYLTNGRVETGNIIESGSDQSITLQKDAERIMVFERSDIEKVVSRKNGEDDYSSTDFESDDPAYKGWGDEDLPAVYVPIEKNYSTNNENNNKLFKDYNRNSISFLMINHLDIFSLPIMASYINQPFDKYDINELPTNQLPVLFPRDANFDIDYKAKQLEDFFNSKNLGKKIISYWYNRRKDGTMDLNRIYDRGMFNANDRIKQIAKNTFDGNQKIKDASDKLVKNSYIVVFDLRNIEKTVSKSGILTWTGIVDTYLFSVAFDDQIYRMVNDSWIYPEDTQAEKNRKKQIFNSIPFRVKFELHTSANVIPNESMIMLNAFNDALNANNKQVQNYSDGSAEFPEFMDRTFSTAMTSLENVRPDFIVKTSIDSTKPVQAKIGKKEGLKRNQMYEVFESVWNDQTQKPEAKKVAIIRATKVIDNRKTPKGSSGLSKFAIIDQSSKIEKNMYIQQKNDRRIGVYADFIAGPETKNIAIGMEKMNFMCTNSLYGSLLMDISMTFNKITDNNNQSNKNFSFCMRLGYEFGINLFTPKVKLAPFGTLGFGASTYNPEVTTTNYNTGQTTSGFNEVGFSFGSKLIYNVNYPWQVYLKAENLWLISAEKSTFCFGPGVQYTF